MNTGVIQKIYNTLLVLFFLSVIAIPLIAGIVREDGKWSEAEKRMLEVFPAVPANISETLVFPQKFGKYYKDHFGFRELMISRYHREMEKRFNVAGTPVVLKGQGKWLFFARNDMLKDFRGELRLTHQDLKVWRSEQQRRYQWLKEKGVHYVVFSPPNKQTVYPEFLPKGYLRIKGITRAEQLHEFLKGDPLPFYINVHKALHSSKSKRKLYYETDTHWNEYGAYVGFQEVMKKVQQLFPNEKFIIDFPFHKHARPNLGGDLAKMLMIDRKVSERNPKVRSGRNCGKKAVFEVPLTDVSTEKYERPLLKKCSKRSLKAVMFSDSFITNLEPFLSENFAEILYLRKRYDQINVEELLERFRPDIVIEESVERNYFR